MRDNLAERLLSEVMKWEPEDVSSERSIIQALAEFKYDEYQQYSPGMRFVESLALWLKQFDDSIKGIAYRFVKERIIFISSAEMNHLVSIAYPDYIRPYLISKAANRINDIPQTYVKKIVNSKEFRVILRQSLFLGLSDGAHIDVFRRSSQEFSNEQVCQSYDISDEKATDLILELEKDLYKILGNPPDEQMRKFHSVFLLDDFSGSGISYLRKDEMKWEGKIYKVLSKILDKPEMFNLDPINICIVLYISTKQAIENLKKLTSELQNKKKNIHFKLMSIHPPIDKTEFDDIKDSQIINWLRNSFDDDILDKHFKRGRIDKPYLGFDECALPLILYHNTPNNSFPILWFDEDKKIRGLFPRISRHKELKKSERTT